MYIITILAIALLIALDRITKYLATINLKNAPSITIIDGVLKLTYVENRGAAFGILQGRTLFFIILTSIMLVLMIIYYIKLPSNRTYNWLRVAIVLIFSGALGNFIDRLFKGYVVDFLYFCLIDFPVFNVADICLVCGTILFAIMTLFFIKE